MLTQDLILGGPPYRQVNLPTRQVNLLCRKAQRFSLSGLQKGAEVATAILITATFTLWFFVLSA